VKEIAKIRFFEPAAGQPFQTPSIPIHAPIRRVRRIGLNGSIGSATMVIRFNS
jgi:hypothetical protein